MDLLKLGRELFLGKESSKSYQSSPDPKEILKSGRPASKLRGKKVAWHLAIESMNAEVSQNEILVLTSYEGENQPGVWLTVDPRQYPEIFNWPSGTMMAVKGEIANLQGNEIYLRNCQLELLKESNKDDLYSW